VFGTSFGAEWKAMAANMHVRNRKISTPNPSLARWKLRYHLRPGDIGYLTHLHGITYAKEHGYDHTFEAYVADGLAEFIRSFSPDKDRIWLAETNKQIIGSIAIVGHSKVEAQLRWFFVHPKYRGIGMGRRLLNEALHFCKERKYRSVFLWTTSELSTAQHLYTGAGFERTRKKTHQIWGRTVMEERYDLDLRNR
jgi:ribosomal protein S18 acetylase RimI-like enzyme